MPALVNGLLGALLLGLSLGLFYGQTRCQALAGWLRERLRSVLGEGLEVHDWVFAAVFGVVGGLALTSALLWVGRSHWFWVLSG